VRGGKRSTRTDCLCAQPGTATCCCGDAAGVGPGCRFIFGFSKLEILFGRQTREEVSSLYRNISKRAVEFRQERVTSIDPHACHVVTDAYV
jgi:hypothetical protein